MEKTIEDNYIYLVNVEDQIYDIYLQSNNDLVGRISYCDYDVDMDITGNIGMKIREKYKNTIIPSRALKLMIILLSKKVIRGKGR